MVKFKDLGIQTEVKGFVGDKIKISKILNKNIIVDAFKISDSKFEKGNGKCLQMQITIGQTKHVVFTGSIGLMESLQKVPAGSFPFETIIVEDNDRYSFT